MKLYIRNVIIVIRLKVDRSVTNYHDGLFICVSKLTKLDLLSTISFSMKLVNKYVYK